MDPKEIIEKRDTFKNRDRIKIPQQAMPEQDPMERRNNIKEVPLGYSEEQARVEAIRCMMCR